MTGINQVPPSEWDRVFTRNPREFDKAPIGSSDPVSDFGEYAGPDSGAPTWNTPDYTRDWEQRKRPEDIAPGIPLTLDEHTETFKHEWAEHDPVQKPAHYNNGGIEAIEYIKQQLGDNFIDYCEGNVIKYLHRHKYKNGIEDLHKAQWYLNKMIEEWTE